MEKYFKHAGSGKVALFLSWISMLSQTPENGDEVLVAISKCQNYPSIKIILGKCNFSFSFKTVSLTDAEKEIESLDTNKASHLSDISTTKIKQDVDFNFSFILGCSNKSISSSTYPSILKLAYIIQYIKNICNTGKVTINLLVSQQIYLKSLKIYCMTDQIPSCFEIIFFKYQIGS